MQQLLDLLIITVNYSHDVATAFLATSALTMWILSLRYPDSGDRELEIYYIKVYLGVTRMAKASFCWILIAGFPRIIYHMEYEWSDIAGDLQVVAIGVKHVVIFILLGGGLYYWLRLAQKVRVLRLRHNKG